MPSSFNLFPIAVTGDDQSVIVETEAGDLYRVIAIPRHGAAPVRTLLSLTLGPDYIDADKNGTLYLDQPDRPIEVLRSSTSGGALETLVGPWSAVNGQYQTLQLPDGRLVLGSSAAGRSRLVAARPGGDPLPFIQTNEETSLPACQVGEGELAFRLGPPDHQVVVVASLADGRIVRRLDGIPGDEVTDLAASPDGKTLYYVTTGTVWAVDITGGQPRRITSGDAVAPDPNGRDLIVQLIAKEGIHLVRLPASGGRGVPVPIQGALRSAPVLISPEAVGKDGRVVVSIAPPDSFFFGAGVLDPRSGKLERIPTNFVGDIVGPEWLSDGRILTSGWPLKGTLWRFRPASKGSN